jgi:hypothetical protein
MFPLEDLNCQKSFTDLRIGKERVDRADIVLNAERSGGAERRAFRGPTVLPPAAGACDARAPFQYKRFIAASAREV